MSDLTTIISSLHEAQSAARSAEQYADDASASSLDAYDHASSAESCANDSSSYASDASERIDVLIDQLETYKNEQSEEPAVKEFIAILELLRNKMADIQDALSATTHIVTSALADMSNKALPLEDKE